MLDGSYESLFKYPEKQLLDPNLWKGMPLQKGLEKVDVSTDIKQLNTQGLTIDFDIHCDWSISSDLVVHLR